MSLWYDSLPGPASRKLVDSVLGYWPEHEAFLERSFAARGEGDRAMTERLAELVLRLHPGDRIGSELRRALSDARESRRHFLQHWAARQDLHFGKERARGFGLGIDRWRMRCRGAARRDLDAGGGAILGRAQPHVRETHGERNDQRSQKNREPAAIRRVRARSVGIGSKPASVDRSMACA